jgi:hypothetical protein
MCIFTHTMRPIVQAGTGTPFHDHELAINMAFAGRKRWLVARPGSTVPAWDGSTDADDGSSTTSHTSESISHTSESGGADDRGSSFDGVGGNIGVAPHGSPSGQADFLQHIMATSLKTSRLTAFDKDWDVLEASNDAWSCWC